VTAGRIVVWRHGRTSWNSTGRFQGQADVDLDETGERQARVAAVALARLEPDAIVASDLSRARRTAETLAELTGLQVRVDRRLREIDVGSWMGLTGEQVRDADPELARRLWAGEDVRRSATGESPTEVGERMNDALTDIAEHAADGSTVVVATHGLAGRVGVCRFVGLPFDQWRLFGGLSNCGWVSLDRHRSGAYWRIEAYNAGVPD
jgi:probable phosphoglycerate mutase